MTISPAMWPTEEVDQRCCSYPPDLDRRTGPARGTAIRGILLGALAPGILLWLAIAAIGRLLTGPLIGWNRSESVWNRSLQDTRDRT